MKMIKFMGWRKLKRIFIFALVLKIYQLETSGEYYWTISNSSSDTIQILYKTKDDAISAFKKELQSGDVVVIVNENKYSYKINLNKGNTSKIIKL